MEKDYSSNIDNVEIEPLSDEDLEDASGGGCLGASCSVQGCSNGKAEKVDETSSTLQ